MADPTYPITCFGKLPFHREYLRIGIDSAAGRWLIRWVEEFHGAVTQGVPVVKGGGVRFAAPAPAGANLLVGILDDSSDGLRRHPVALQVEIPATGSWAQWPLLAEPVWESLRSRLRDPYGSVDAFSAVLHAGAAAPDVTGAGGRLDQALHATAAEDPWVRLSGVAAPAVQHVALNLRSVVLAQRDARSREEGVAFAVPIGDAAPAVPAAVWLAALGQAVPTAPGPLIVLPDGGGHLVVSFRPLGGDEVAAVLAGDWSSVDDLGEAWQALPPKDPAVAAAVACVGSAAGGTLADVVAWARTATTV